MFVYPSMTYWTLLTVIVDLQVRPHLGLFSLRVKCGLSVSYCIMACMTGRRILQSLTLTLFIFGFAGWVYIVINSEVHMWTLGRQLTHFSKWPHEDTFGEMCFLVSFISFFVYNLVKDPKMSKRD